MTNDTNLNKLVINKLTKAQYQEAKESNSIVETEIYMITDADEVINADTLGGRPASDYATQSFVTNKIAEAQVGGGGDIDLSGYATKDDLNNIDYPVDSVNGKTGIVSLSAEDVGAAPTSHNHDGRYLRGYSLNEINIDNTEGNWTVDISDDAHGTVPASWVNVTQTSAGHFLTQIAIETISSSDTTRKNGRVWHREKYIFGQSWSAWSLFYDEGHKPTASDVGARPDTWMPTATEIGAIPTDPSTRTEIPTGTDIKEFFCTNVPLGYYYCTHLSTLVNAPIDVQDWWFFNRTPAGIYAYRSGEPNRKWVGTPMNGTFYGWNEIYTTLSKPTASDVGARASDWLPTPTEIGAQPALGFTPAVGAGNINGADANTVTTSGMYRIGNEANIPTGAHYGHLMVVCGDGETIAQIAFNYAGSNDTPPKMWVRTGWLGGGTWSAWKRVITEDSFSYSNGTLTITI